MEVKKEVAPYNSVERSISEDADLTYGLDLIGSKWKLLISRKLSNGALRFGEIKQRLPQLSERMLTVHLRQLQEAGLVRRHAYNEVPPRVEYELTYITTELFPALVVFREWAAKYKRLNQK